MGLIHMRYIQKHCIHLSLLAIRGEREDKERENAIWKRRWIAGSRELKSLCLTLQMQIGKVTDRSSRASHCGMHKLAALTNLIHGLLTVLLS